MPSSDEPTKSKAKGTAPPDAQLRVKEQLRKKPSRRNFPGPSGSKVPLRVAMDRSAYAAVSSHAADSLTAEICGVLAGTLCEDDEGPFLLVEAAVRGDASRQGSTHVTFTHETWEAIARTMDKDHPKLDIVGWYHSHPGFGVEFSEMDLFIQKNFFSLSTQVAMVVDPLGGQVAMCVNTLEGIRYIDRFWVEGREVRCQLPQRSAQAETAASENQSDSSSAGMSPTTAKDLGAAMQAMQIRLSQAIQAADEQRAWIHRTVVTFGMFICTALIIWIGFSMWRSYTAPLTPPELTNTYVPVTIMIDGKPVMLGVGIVKWQVPPELNAAIVQVERERRNAAAAATAPSTQPSESAPQTK